MDKLILIIEDDPAIVRLLTLALKTNNYQSLVAENGLNGISLFLSNHPDLVLLDLGLPDIDGTEVLEQIRNISNTPVIVISARDNEKEKIYALDNGADDYVTKPFNVGELLARIRVALRNNNQQISKKQTFEYQNLFIDFAKHQVRLDDKEVHLTPIEFKLLQLLAQHQGKVLTHSYIQNEIWGYPSEDEYQSLRVYMTTLRRKLDDGSQPNKFIITEIGVGYRFTDD